MTNPFDDAEIISEYTLEQGVSDGQLVAILPHRWEQLNTGRPIVATAAISANISLAGIMEIWNEYVLWTRNKAPFLPEAERMFKTKMNGDTVWVIDDGTAITVLYSSDY